MRKLFVAGLVSFVCFNTSKADEVKQYWDRFYNEIKQCVLHQVKSDTVYKPISKIENENDIRAYLRSLDYKGYVVFINTKNLKEQDICFITFAMKSKSFSPVFYKPAEILFIAEFSRETDALALKEELSALTKDVYVLKMY